MVDQEKLSFERATYEDLCSCVHVELSDQQSRLIDAWPSKSESIVKSAILNGQQRHVDGECVLCKGSGLATAFPTLQK